MIFKLRPALRPPGTSGAGGLSLVQNFAFLDEWRELSGTYQVERTATSVQHLLADRAQASYEEPRRVTTGRTISALGGKIRNDQAHPKNFCHTGARACARYAVIAARRLRRSAAALRCMRCCRTGGGHGQPGIEHGTTGPGRLAHDDIRVVPAQLAQIVVEYGERLTRPTLGWGRRSRSIIIGVAA